MRPRWARVAGWVVVGIYAVLAGGLLLWPDGERVRRALLDVYLFGLNVLGLPPSMTPDRWALLGNVLLLLPLACVATLRWGRRWWWVVAVAGVVAGVVVESLQAGLGLSRVVDPVDALCNGLGALLGAGLGALVDHRLVRGDREGR